MLSVVFLFCRFAFQGAKILCFWRRACIIIWIKRIFLVLICVYNSFDFVESLVKFDYDVDYSFVPKQSDWIASNELKWDPPCIPGTAGTNKKEKDLSKDSQNKLETAQLSSESCKLCGKSVANIKKHMKSHFPDKYQCHICMISLTRSDNLKRHIKLKHGIREGSLMSPFMRLEAKHFLAKSEASYLT